ncbi:MAG: TIGR00730 family Rossman fold protein [Sphaerochaetaceae bacterium]|nr:TIGR00730 family Rossman fold protein [Sphaerochaetaceae bacterium]
MMHRLTVFCGSTMGSSPIYRDMAVTLAEAMRKAGLDLVYGGGNRGLMGVVADTLKSLGGTTIGVLPQAMDLPQVRTKQVESQLIITDGMHSRKEKMYELGDGFLALPGGIGTMEELMEAYTWRQLGYHHKPVALLDVDGYWKPLLDMLHKSVEAGFLDPRCLQTLLVDDNPSRLLDRMASQHVQLPDKLSP